MSMADEDIRDEGGANAACVCERQGQDPSLDPGCRKCLRPQQPVTLLSTVVAPAFVAGTLRISPLSPSALADALSRVSRNLCGHPVTDGVLREICPSLPKPERAFWDGTTLGLAVRPRGGVRGARATGDTQCTFSDLEAVWVEWTPD